MYVETKTKKLAQTILLLAASSLCAILLCMGSTARHNALAKRAVNFPVYTYQNPFSLTDSASSTAFSQTRAGRLLTQLISVKWALRLSGLGAIWLASTWYLNHGWTPKKRIHRNIKYTIEDSPEKMNPLAIIPKPFTRVVKQDTSRPAVLCQTNTRCLVAHRKITAPCQSRFRPVTLVSSQTRFGRLK
jgi:hypothetical protein